ncbi:MAG TPA: nuclear transport factor 2 family protein [Pseudonocardiaceae bacterium]|nr:nuclear transport factor 2 family protein [Pseudonocardiaceae bacterium]
MDIKELVQKSVDDWNAKDKKAFIGNFTERSEITAPGGLVLHGLASVEELWDIWQGALPDNQGAIGTVFAAGDRACAEVIFEGTQTGTLHIADGQLPATGRRVCVPVAQVHTICDGKFVTSHLYFDQFGLLAELGLIPISGAAAGN